MNEKQAIAALKKIVGQKLGWRVDNKAPGVDERAAFSAEHSALRLRERELRDQLDAKRAELLRDPAYVALREQHQQAKEGADRAGSMSRHYRITVGKIGGDRGFNYFHVMAQADTWDAAVEKIKAV